MEGRAGNLEGVLSQPIRSTYVKSKCFPASVLFFYESWFVSIVAVIVVIVIIVIPVSTTPSPSVL